MKEETQAADTYVAIKCIMARLATMTWEAYWLFIKCLILIFCMCVLCIIHTDTPASLEFVE